MAAFQEWGSIVLIQKAVPQTLRADAPLYAALGALIPGTSFALPLSLPFLTDHLILGGKLAYLLQGRSVHGWATHPCSRASWVAESSVGVVMCHLKSSNLRMYI